MLPGLLFALFERHGQPLEVVIQQMIQCCFIRPKERPYQTNNAYAALVRQYQMEQEVKAIVQKNDTPRNRKAQKAHPRPEKEIDAVLRKYKGDGKPRTAQATIPYEAIYPDGVCRIDRRTFSKCIAFEDISYQLAQPETRTAIFEHLCDLYNYVDASIHVQLSFLNRKVDPVQYAKSFEIAPQG